MLITSETVSAQSLLETMQEEDSLSRYAITEEGKPIVTLKELEVLEDQAKGFFDAGECEKAAEIDFSGHANRIANIIRQGIEPYYSADRDDRETMSRRAGFDQLVTAERVSNGMLMKRNEFWALEAKCFFERGDTDEALPRLFRALEYLDGEGQARIWLETRQMLWSVIGYD